MTRCMEADWAASKSQMFDGPMPERVLSGASAGSLTGPSGLAVSTIQQPGTLLSMAAQLLLSAWADWADVQQAAGEQRPTVRVHSCQAEKRGTPTSCGPSTKLT